MPFVHYNWEVKNQEKSDLLLSFVLWFHQWRLPLLFFISGAGIYFSLKKRNLFQFVVERLRRLLIPLLFAMFFTIPIQVYVEFLQNGKVTGNYFSFYPSVWKCIPYPDGALTWSHMWFVVYLIAFIFLLLPLLALMKIRAVESIKDCISNFIAKPYILVLVILIVYYNYNLFYIKYPEQGSLIDDNFVFNSSLTYLILGNILAGSAEFWENCEKFRFWYLSAAICSSTLLFIAYFLPNHLPKTESSSAQIYFIINSIQIWSIIISIIGFAKNLLNYPSALLSYLNTAVFPFFIIHQTIIVALGYWVVQMHTSIFIKFVLLSVFSGLLILGLYEFIIRRTVITRFLYGMKSKKTADKLMPL
jgi:hypothetical protein